MPAANYYQNTAAVGCWVSHCQLLKCQNFQHWKSSAADYSDQPCLRLPHHPAVNCQRQCLEDEHFAVDLFGWPHLQMDTEFQN
jgi:hypothetical protein